MQASQKAAELLLVSLDFPLLYQSPEILERQRSFSSSLHRNRSFLFGKRTRLHQRQVEMSLQYSPQAPWRNNNITFQNKETPVSEQGETIIGIYLLALGTYWLCFSPLMYIMLKRDLYI